MFAVKVGLREVGIDIPAHLYEVEEACAGYGRNLARNLRTLLISRRLPSSAQGWQQAFNHHIYE
jgi:hypothetical protein